MTEIGSTIHSTPKVVETFVLVVLMCGTEDARRKAGDDGDRDDETECHRTADGDGNISEQLPRLFLDEHDRYEDRDGGQRTGQDRAQTSLAPS